MFYSLPFFLQQTWHVTLGEEKMEVNKISTHIFTAPIRPRIPSCQPLPLLAHTALSYRNPRYSSIGKTNLTLNDAYQDARSASDVSHNGLGHPRNLTKGTHSGLHPRPTALFAARSLPSVFCRWNSCLSSRLCSPTAWHLDDLSKDPK